jgi:hypothetical protein
MIQRANDAQIERLLPALCELCRAVSGVVGIMVLAAVLGGMALAAEFSPEEPSSPKAVYPTSLQPRADHPRAQTTALYLVRDHQQERLASMVEAERSVESPVRPYGILFIRDDHELALAAEGMVAFGQTHRGSLLEIIDLRSIQ